VRTKVTLVLIFLNVALFFFIFKFERHWNTESLALEARRKVLGPEASDIRSLEITSATPAGSFSLARRGDTWWVTKPLPEWPANRLAVERIVNELKFLENITSFPVRDLAKNEQSLANYGLDKPKFTIAFTSGEATNKPAAPVTLQIGDVVGTNLYVLSSDGERVHVVSRVLLDSLTLPIEQLRADTLFTIPVYEARSLILPTAAAWSQERDAPPTASTASSIYIRREPKGWVFETPITARASKDSVELTINELNALRVKTFVTENLPRPTATPRLRLRIEGNNRRETLLLGEAVPSAPTEFYAQFEDRSGPRAALFTVVVPPKLREKLGNAEKDLRERHILDFDANGVAAITLTAPNQTQLVLQRLDTKGSQPASPAGVWQIVRRGETTLASPAADPAAIQHLLDKLSQLSATEFVTEAAEASNIEKWGFNRPEREITLTIEGTPARTLSVQIGLTAARDKAYARLGSASNPGLSIYAVDPAILDETRVEPYIWRDRNLRAELPSAAKFTGLKLTDLTTKQTLLEITFDAAGNPTAAVRDATAVTNVLASLRTLRARRFTQEAFSERVFLAGEERPWRYELTATASPASGAGGEQTITTTLLLSERGGGTQQLAGSREKEFNAVFELEQPFVDALWTLIYGPRDPGPPAATTASPAEAKK
jgi:hypothetical protein